MCVGGGGGGGEGEGVGGWHVECVLCECVCGGGGALFGGYYLPYIVS